MKVRAALATLAVLAAAAVAAPAGAASPGTSDAPIPPATTPAAMASPAPGASPAPPYSFDAALRRILERSTDVGIARAGVGIAEAQAIPVRAFFLPTLNASANVVHSASSGAVTANGEVLSGDTTDRRVQGEARLNLFRFGGDLAAWRAATAEEERAESRLAATSLSVEDLGVRAVTQSLLDAALVDIYLRTTRTREESFDIAHARYSRGYLPEQEVDKVRVDLDNTRATLADARVRADQSLAELERLLGPGALEAVWPWKSRGWPTEPDAIARRLPARPPLETRPDVRAARSRVAAESERLTANERSLLPTLDTGLSVGNSQANGFYWTGTLSMNFPIFDRFATISQVRAQRFTRLTAEMERDAVERQAVSEWESSRRDFQVTLVSAQAREKTVRLSRQLYQDNLRRFQAGRISANDLTVDLQRLIDSERLEAEGWAAFHLAVARVCHAMGQLVTGNCSLLSPP